MKRKQNGFSLIELLIVVAIILIMMAIAIPNYLRSRLVANESSAVESVRTINTAAVTYSTVYQSTGFPPSLVSMGGPDPCTATSTSACLLDSVLGAGTKAGFTFLYTNDGLTPSVGYSVTGTPVNIGVTGQKMFCSDQSSVIRYDPSGAGCTGASNPIQ